MRRYTSRPLPEPRYVPGRSPHPTRDSEEEQAVGSEQSTPLDPLNWEICDDYLYGIDLFNHGYWWEAHEVFEVFWRAAGRGTLSGEFLQGLIQIAAALLKDAVQSRAAAEGLGRSGCMKLRSTRGIFFGVDREALASAIESFLAGRSQTPPRIDLVFARRWSVWRQDAHGSRFEIRHGLTRDEALQLVADFESRGHKQGYWLQAEDGR